jgi:hypothetical protein
MFSTTSGPFKIHEQYPYIFEQIIRRPGTFTRPFAARAFRPPSHQSAAKVGASDRKRNEVSIEVPSLSPVAGAEVEVLIADAISCSHLIHLLGKP